jgi:putative transposase
MCGVKYRAYPTDAQAKALSQWIGCARVIYNCKVQEDHEHYKRFKETGAKSLVHQGYAHFKTLERPWLKDVPSQILRNSAVTWYQAKQRFFKGLAKNPRTKNKDKKQSVLLTKELFSLTKELNIIRLKIGTKRHDMGYLQVKFHRECGIPKQIVISKKNHQWYVSFCYETNVDLPSDEELISHYASLPESELNQIIVGIDRGIVVPFQVSNDTQFNFDEATQMRLEQKKKRLKRYQRKMAKQQLASKRRKRTKLKTGKLQQKIANVRHNFCHQTSHQLVESNAHVFAVEDLSLKNMTRAPQPKQDQNGRYLPNQRSAKAGLNRELLSKGLAKTIDFLAYKAKQAGKCVIYVSSRHSSQECARCSHIHPDNRKTQAIFLCLSCGHQANADINAAQVIAKRGVQYLLSKPKFKTTTRLGTSLSYARRGSYKSTEESPHAQVPLTLEARSL